MWYIFLALEIFQNIMKHQILGMSYKKRNVQENIILEGFQSLQDSHSLCLWNAICLLDIFLGWGMWWGVEGREGEICNSKYN